MHCGRPEGSSTKEGHVRKTSEIPPGLECDPQDCAHDTLSVLIDVPRLGEPGDRHYVRNFS